MGTSLIRAMLLASAGAAVAAVGTPTAAYAQEATYQIDIPAQSMGDALRALGKATKQNIVFIGSVVKGKRSSAVRGRMSASDALAQMLAGSGLKMGRGSGGGFTVVQGGNASGGASGAARVAQGQGRGIIVGTVRDNENAAPLKGALIELLETGETARSDDRGEFRFARAPLGDVTLRVSYLGYPRYSTSVSVAAGDPASVDVLLGNNPNEEIVVLGTVSARAQALNQERTADNTRTVISADVLGQFEGTTISEALRRAPGVSFQRDVTTGDGVNINVRGLEPDMNTVKFNGVELPESSGRGRSAALNNILADSVESITISKTLLPSQDSSGTGGLVEIQTKGPLDRSRRYLQFGFEKGLRSKGFGGDILLTGTASMKLGSDERFGISAAVQYREREVATFRYNRSNFFGQHLPLASDGSLVFSAEEIDPRTPFPFEDSATNVYLTGATASLNRLNTETLGVTLSAEWRPTDNSSLKLDYQKSKSDSRSVYSNSGIAASVFYTPIPIDSLGGEERSGLIYGDFLSPYIGGGISAVSDTTDLLTFKGDAEVGRFRIAANLGYTVGSRRSSGQNIFGSYVSSLDAPGLIDSSALDYSEGRLISPFPAGEEPGFFPLLTPAGVAALNDSSQYFVSGFDSGRARGRNNRYVGELTINYQPPVSFIEDIEAGVAYKRSRFTDQALPEYFGYGLAAETLGDVGLAFSAEDAVDVGIHSLDMPYLSRDGITGFFANLDRFVSDGSVGVSPATADSLDAAGFTREAELAAYLQTKLKFGNLTVVGGVRLSNLKIKARNTYSPTLIREDFTPDLEFADRFRMTSDEAASRTDILPRVAATYRFNDRTMVRVGYYLSVARPQIGQLSDATQFTLFLPPRFGPTGDRPLLGIAKGNPDLKPARTHSFDLSLERYSETVGAIKLGVFYKKIENTLQNNFVTGGLSDLTQLDLPDDPRFDLAYLESINVFVRGFRPENGTKSASIYGVEASVEHRFTRLPGILSGLGIYANYTHTRSDFTREYVWSQSPILDSSGIIVGREAVKIQIPNQPFTSQPRHSGTLSLLYSKYGIDSSISYTYQSNMQGGFQANGLSIVDRAQQSLDARFSYIFPSGGLKDLRLYVEGSDLLHGQKYAGTAQSQGGYDFQRSYYGGRSIRLGLSKSF